MRIAFGMLMLMMSASTLAEEVSFESFVRNLLPAGTCSVDIIQPQAPQRLQDLTIQFKTAIQKQQSWFLEYTQAQDLQPGQIMPYHSNFGITSNEYAEMIELMNHFEPIRVGSTPLTVSWEQAIIVISSSYFDAITINLQKESVQTEYGTSYSPTRVIPNDMQKMGKWSGYNWHIDTINTSSFSGVDCNISIGTMVASGKILLMLTGGEIKQGRPIRRTDVTMEWTKQGTQPAH